MSALVEAAASPDERIQTTAIRALGRLERREVVPHLLQYLRAAHARTRAEAAFAVAQAMHGDPLDAAPGQVENVLSALLAAARGEADGTALGEMARSVARLPFERPEQVDRAEALLRQVLTLSKELSLVRRQQGNGAAAVTGAVAGAELRGRLHTKLSAPSQELVDLLRRHVTGQVNGVPPAEAPPPAQAFQALISARGVDHDTLVHGVASLDDNVRRLAIVALSSSGSPVTGEERASLLRKAMGDRAFFVRYEAVRGYARSSAKTDGCGPILERAGDANPHVALAAIDALGDACSAAEDVEAIISFLLGEARTPPTTGSWHRESHAIVALAKLSPSLAEIPLQSHSRHAVWQVRMYAARAAGAMKDVATLERLALDAHDNVREATLATLRRLEGNGAEPQFVAALGRRDYQLLRTAAIEMKGLTPTDALTQGLVDALKRVTDDKKDTARDTRTAVIERLREFGRADVPQAADPPPAVRPPLPTADEVAFLHDHAAVLVMETGANIEMSLDADTAPLNAVRFLRLSNANYFDGLTFHRVVPNFVIQGGSPGANEYAGDGPYVRDEISRQSHVQGTIGLSTRGHDTGDAQFFINLADNPRLDFQYTVFGRIVGRSLSRVLDVLEGDRIRDVRWIRRPGAPDRLPHRPSQRD